MATTKATTLAHTIASTTSSTADLDYAKTLNDTGVTSTEFDKLDGLTATTTELNKLSGVTATTTELNKLSGVNATTDELNLVDGSVTGPLSHRNMIINGGMQVAQRISGVIGNSGAVSGSGQSGYYTVDRFRTQNSGVTIESTIQNTGQGLPFTENGLNNYFRQKVTSTASGVSNFTEISYRIEGQDIWNSGWNPEDPNSKLTLSFYARCSLAGTYYVWFTNTGGTSYTYTLAFTLSANTWQRVSMTIPGNSNLSGMNQNNTEGLRINWVPHYGTTYTGHSEAVTGSWYNRTQLDGYLPNFNQSFINTANATFDLTGVQLELGSVATPFESRSYADELKRCQRYFAVLVDNDINWAQNIGSFYNASRCFTKIPLQTKMRVEPTTITSTNIAGNAYSNNNGYSFSVVSHTYTDSASIGLDLGVSSAPAGNACHVDFTSDSKITASAEL